MTMTPLESKTVYSLADIARFLLQEVKPRLDMLNVDYDATGGVKETLQQGDLDEDANLSGITKAQVDDGAYVLTNNIRTIFNDSYAQLEQLAARGTINNTFQPF